MALCIGGECVCGAPCACDICTVPGGGLLSTRVRWGSSGIVHTGLARCTSTVLSLSQALSGAWGGSPRWRARVGTWSGSAPFHFQGGLGQLMTEAGTVTTALANQSAHVGDTSTRLSDKGAPALEWSLSLPRAASRRVQLVAQSANENSFWHGPAVRATGFGHGHETCWSCCPQTMRAAAEQTVEHQATQRRLVPI